MLNLKYPEQKEKQPEVLKAKIKKSLLFEEKVKLKISENINNQLVYTCTQLSNLEWAGVLFLYYKNDEIVVDSFLPLIYESSVSVETDLELEKYITKYREEKYPNNYEIIVGRIHSHNNMGKQFV